MLRQVFCCLVKFVFGRFLVVVFDCIVMFMLVCFIWWFSLLQVRWIVLIVFVGYVLCNMVCWMVSLVFVRESLLLLRLVSVEVIIGCKLFVLMKCQKVLVVSVKFGGILMFWQVSVVIILLSDVFLLLICGMLVCCNVLNQIMCVVLLIMCCFIVVVD